MFFFIANGNDSKKFKGDIRSPGVPSRVIHVRKLPNDINEAEVIALGLPFGKVTNLLMLKGKNQVKITNCFIFLYVTHLNAFCSFTKVQKKEQCLKFLVLKV